MSEYVNRETSALLRVVRSQGTCFTLQAIICQIYRVHPPAGLFVAVAMRRFKE